MFHRALGYKNFLHFVGKIYISVYVIIGLWCNGSTTDFGSVCLSSNLDSPTAS